MADKAILESLVAIKNTLENLLTRVEALESVVGKKPIKNRACMRGHVISSDDQIGFSGNCLCGASIVNMTKNWSSDESSN